MSVDFVTLNDTNVAILDNRVKFRFANIEKLIFEDFMMTISLKDLTKLEFQSKTIKSRKYIKADQFTKLQKSLLFIGDIKQKVKEEMTKNPKLQNPTK